MVSSIGREAVDPLIWQGIDEVSVDHAGVASGGLPRIDKAPSNRSLGLLPGEAGGFEASASTAVLDDSGPGRAPPREGTVLPRGRPTLERIGHSAPYIPLPGSPLRWWTRNELP